MNLTPYSSNAFSLIDADRQPPTSRIRTIATRDPRVIRLWAARHAAQPATGEATESGPEIGMHVNDGGAGIRFNFPGAARFRPISWDEWLRHFQRQHLVFLYEEEIVDRAYFIWQQRGGGDGGALDDWLRAERELGSDHRTPTARYGLIRDE